MSAAVAVLSLVLSVLAGFASALFPLMNAEALAAGASRANRDLLPVVVVALAAGQTIGKLTLFELAGRGASRLGRRPPRRPHRKGTIARIAASHATGLRSASSKLPVVAMSAFTGLPPLAAVAVAAGTTSTKRSGFAAACFTGRALRFGLIAYGTTFLFLH
jgi:membrane protein YqaA with SNARE-associated domain